MKISVQFGFLPQYLLLFNPDSAFCFLFFSQLLMTCNDRCSHKLLQRNSSFHFIPNKMYLTQYDVIYKTFQLQIQHFGPFWIMFQIQHFGSCFRYSILFLFSTLNSLVFDRLGGQVSEEKEVGTLDKVKKLIIFFLRNCRYGILYCQCGHPHTETKFSLTFPSPNSAFRCGFIIYLSSRSL